MDHFPLDYKPEYTPNHNAIAAMDNILRAATFEEAKEYNNCWHKLTAIVNNKRYSNGVVMSALLGTLSMLIEESPVTDRNATIALLEAAMTYFASRIAGVVKQGLH